MSLMFAVRRSYPLTRPVIMNAVSSLYAGMGRVLYSSYVSVLGLEGRQVPVVGDTFTHVA